MGEEVSGWAGALAGAEILGGYGAAMGFEFGGPLGAAVGGAIGGIAGSILGYMYGTAIFDNLTSPNDEFYYGPCDFLGIPTVVPCTNGGPL